MTRGIAAAALAALLVMTHGWAWRQGAERAEARHAVVMREAVERVRQTERDLVRVVDRVAGDAYARETETDRADDAAGAAVRRLLATIADRDTRARDTTAAAERDAATARGLLAQCAERHRAMARDADRVRSNLLTLQSYIKDVCRKGQP